MNQTKIKNLSLNEMLVVSGGKEPCEIAGENMNIDLCSELNESEYGAQFVNGNGVACRDINTFKSCLSACDNKITYSAPAQILCRQNCYPVYC